MPARFDLCVRQGGRVRTIPGPSSDYDLESGQYLKICFPKGGGPAVRGHIETARADAVKQERSSE